MRLKSPRIIRSGRWFFVIGALYLFGLYGLLDVVRTGGIGGWWLPAFLLGRFEGLIGVEVVSVWREYSIR